MPYEYEKECELVSRLGEPVVTRYCSNNERSLCPVYKLKRQMSELRAENSLLKASEGSYREQVAKGLERIIEVVREIQR